MGSIVSVKDLIVGYKKLKVLGPLTFELPENKLIAAIGVNGSGKSTLMKSIAGILAPLAGQIEIGNRSLKSFSLKELSTVRSFFTTSFEGYVNYNLEEILSISRYPFTNWLGKLSERDSEMVERSLKITNLISLRERMIYELSDGERQKLIIARAFCQDTPIIFLDEPFVHLDLKQKSLMSELISKLVIEESKSLLVATHDLDFVEKHCDLFLAIYKDGEVKLREATEIRSKALIEDLFQISL